MSGATVRLEGRSLKAEAKQLVAFSGAVQQQLDLFGDGHPQVIHLCKQYLHCFVVVLVYLTMAVVAVAVAGW